MRYVDDPTFESILRRLYFLEEGPAQDVSPKELEAGVKTLRYKIIQHTANAHD